ncbi:hypothetical protein Scep_014314 [Stephania cephalantha]|uniref:Uncharacterized protein n=1 Tax=Stephania cephalantha TaxID=152367 RepID=A0AAP0P089_9MAGN
MWKPLMPPTLFAFSIIRENTSAITIKRNGEREHSCLNPRLALKLDCGLPFNMMENEIDETHPDIHFLNFEPNPFLMRT